MNTQLIGDSHLLALYQKGNKEALAHLIGRHKDRVYTTIYLFVRDELLAEDLFQDTFIKVIEMLRQNRYNDEGKFLPWVLRIAHNLCVDHYRRTKRFVVVKTSDGQDVFDMLKFSGPSPEQDLFKKQTYDAIRELIDCLPEEQREVVVLRHYADLSFKEIAEMTDVSINTALGRMRYALANLRRMISEKQIAL